MSFRESFVEIVEASTKNPDPLHHRRWFVYLRVNYFHNGSNEWTGCILSPIATTHCPFSVFWLRRGGYLMLGMGAKTQLINKANYPRSCSHLVCGFEFEIHQFIFNRVGSFLL